MIKPCIATLLIAASTSVYASTLLCPTVENMNKIVQNHPVGKFYTYGEFQAQVVNNHKSNSNINAFESIRLTLLVGPQTKPTFSKFTAFTYRCIYSSAESNVTFLVYNKNTNVNYKVQYPNKWFGYNLVGICKVSNRQSCGIIKSQ